MATARGGSGGGRTSSRVLIVANRTAATPRLLDDVKRVARERPSSFRLLIPDVPKSAQSDWTMELALPLLERAAGSSVDGLTGRHDPFEAIRQFGAAAEEVAGMPTRAVVGGARPTRALAAGAR